MAPNWAPTAKAVMQSCWVCSGLFLTASDRAMPPICGHQSLAHALAAVLGDGVGDLVTHDHCHAHLVPADGQDAGVEGHLAAGHAPGVDLVALDEVEFPGVAVEVAAHALLGKYCSTARWMRWPTRRDHGGGLGVAAELALGHAPGRTAGSSWRSSGCRGSGSAACGRSPARWRRRPARGRQRAGSAGWRGARGTSRVENALAEPRVRYHRSPTAANRAWPRSTIAGIVARNHRVSAPEVPPCSVSPPAAAT